MRRLEIRDLIESPTLYPAASVYFVAVFTLMAYSTGRVSIWQCITGMFVAALLILVAFVVKELNQVHEDVVHLVQTLDEAGLPVPPISAPPKRRR